ncbi:hypothetical protein DFS33DRAFT_908037 [Desarmillaria ectypa]|nr:hypothetical protein DFS33DRAFT_908037 [Desarmillaria ectypa]
MRILPSWSRMGGRYLQYLLSVCLCSFFRCLCGGMHIHYRLCSSSHTWLDQSTGLRLAWVFEKGRSDWTPTLWDSGIQAGILLSGSMDVNIKKPEFFVTQSSLRWTLITENSDVLPKLLI